MRSLGWGTTAFAMDPGGGAFGGGKAGAAQDPISFLKRPGVIVRICGLVSANMYSLSLSHTARMGP